MPSQSKPSSLKPSPQTPKPARGIKPRVESTDASPAPKQSKHAVEPKQKNKRLAPPDSSSRKRQKKQVESDLTVGAEENKKVSSPREDTHRKNQATPTKPKRVKQKGKIAKSESEAQGTESDEELGDFDDESQKPVTKVASTGPVAHVSDDATDDEAIFMKNRLVQTGPAKDDSESDMSELIDEGPMKKGRKRKSDVSETQKGSKTSKSKRKEKAAKPQDIDPDTEEIKRLQGWLIKCGIRKMWYKELAPFETSKAKMRHLKEMISDAGMTGRYSAEKASEIKESRELQADLEAVQAGAKQWGTAESEGEDESGRPRRRLARGLQGLDFLNDDDGEETD